LIKKGRPFGLPFLFLFQFFNALRKQSIMNQLNVLLNHKTVRRYKEINLGKELLSEIIVAGCRASTTGNMQLYSIINTTRKDIKEKLAPVHFNQKMILQAPNILTFCADFNRFNQWCNIRDAIPGYDNFLSFITAAIDAIIVAQNIAVAAETQGLGICYIGTTIYNAEQIIDILNLPKGVVPVTTLTIGWPDEEPPITDRLPIEAIVHNETYKDYTPDEISSYYSLKEGLSENIQYVIENSKSTLAQVFTDVRYKKEDNELFSKKLIQVLKNQGFL
jgi:nitroreductase